jgi:hypothetical protein
MHADATGNMPCREGGGQEKMTPSVTRIIDPWVDLSKIPPDTLQAAADRGTAVHDLCLNFYAKGFFTFAPKPLEGYYHSFIAWFDLMVKEVVLVEQRLTDSDLMYSGQIDLLARSKDKGDLILVDLKTPLTKSKSWRLQLAAYSRLCEVNSYVPDRIGSLQLSPDGKMAKMEWYKESAMDLNYFVQALGLYRFFHS